MGNTTSKDGWSATAMIAALITLVATFVLGVETGTAMAAESVSLPVIAVMVFGGLTSILILRRQLG